MIALSFYEAIETLQTRIGPDSAQWKLKNLQKFTLEHQPFAGVPGLNKIFNMEGPAEGNRRTPNMAFYAF